MSPGPLQIILIIVVILLLFGAGRVPGIMENLAKGIQSFKRGLKDESSGKKQIAKKDKANEKD